ncbi:hypothetical protein EYS14_20255 [Alteromonadaceae bacterium M269]|nr:hypothetical protein EYS14_20255 [Alteromonadaceae bacterium M269]
MTTLNVDKVSSKKVAYLFWFYNLICVLSALGMAATLFIFNISGIDIQHAGLIHFLERNEMYLVFFCLLLILFIAYMTYVLRSLAEIKIINEQDVIVDTLKVSSSDISSVREVVIFNYSFAFMKVKGVPKYWIPRKNLTLVPLAFYMKPKNELILRVIGCLE